MHHDGRLSLVLAQHDDDNDKEEEECFLFYSDLCDAQLAEMVWKMKLVPSSEHEIVTQMATLRYISQSRSFLNCA